ncbi:DUF3649 domain-containing protein [Comamonas koreensis]|uniref:DUF3649 domain-containing protein n=1 Tax=Comamonas koreensis TaxID=160825 RepID=A0AAW4XVA7_9BURK|nr:DUF3649 domain-containing protein [Comamonas koreensis]MCD2164953.1 DUF3649 domain-containing protein [Comamonas koreensis]
MTSQVLSGALRAALAKACQVGPLLSRIAAAIGGGYALAAVASVAVLALPMAKPQAVLAGTMASFLVYTGAVIWVFAVRSATRAWVGLLLAAIPLLLAAWPVWNGVTPA